jgi:hypothetical protein
MSLKPVSRQNSFLRNFRSLSEAFDDCTRPFYIIEGNLLYSRPFLFCFLRHGLTM